MHEIYHISELEKINEKPRLTSWCTLSPSTMDFTARRCKLRTRRKLQNDAVATSILGWLCEQFPEVFQTHVMPHLTDADLRSLVLLGSSPRRVLRSSSRADKVFTSHLSRLKWFARVLRVEPARSARSMGCAQHGLRAPSPVGGGSSYRLVLQVQVPSKKIFTELDRPVWMPLRRASI